MEDVLESWKTKQDVDAEIPAPEVDQGLDQVAGLAAAANPKVGASPDPRARTTRLQDPAVAQRKGLDPGQVLEKQRRLAKTVLGPDPRLTDATTDPNLKKTTATLVLSPETIVPVPDPKKTVIVLDPSPEIAPNLERPRKNVPGVRAGQGQRATDRLFG